MADRARTGGLLLHVTSLPGTGPIGNLGEEAYRFVDFLAAAGQRRWQVLPLGPVGPGDSPYASFSAFAGNPLLVSPERLVEDGYLNEGEVPAPGDYPATDYAAAKKQLMRLFTTAFERFEAQPPPAAKEALAAFCARQSTWLDDYALFIALKRHYGGAPWYRWEKPVRHREPAEVAAWMDRLADTVRQVCFEQFLFFSQWERLRKYANNKEVSIIGDVPIFVPLDSADVWVSPHLFKLDGNLRPTVVAGVPPDYFSETGQLWGNPLYRWEAHGENDFAWWVARVRAALALTDIVRIDHFRGFCAAWEVPADQDNAMKGEWVPGPGIALFDRLEEALGCGHKLPLIAEDLGLITDDVVALREATGLPGMAVLQFAFDSDDTNPHLPHNQVANQVVYTGTHDNNTTAGWFAGLSPAVRKRVCAYLDADGENIPLALAEAARNAVAGTCIIPVQDLLGLPGSARMNRPGVAAGNWTWRLAADALDGERAADLRARTIAAGR